MPTYTPTAWSYVGTAASSGVTGIYQTQTNDSFWTVGTGGYSTYNNNVWTVWQTTNTTAANRVVRTRAVDTRTPEERKRDEWKAAQARIISSNRHRAATLRRRIADREAERLLVSQLTPEQRDELERLDRFHVIAGDKTYRIRRGWAGNIDLIEDDQIVERWCVHPARQIPVADSMVAQKLMIESGCADELRGIANVTAMRRAA